MTENAKNPTDQKTIQDPPEYNAENAKNPKEGSDWLGGPQNGNETTGKSTYQQNGQTWLGGPQNGNETPSKQTEGAYQTASHSTGWENRETEVKPLETSKKPSKLGGSTDN